MWPLIYAVLKRYSAVIVFPVALIVGTIGYNVERKIREGEVISSRPSVQKERQERLLNESQARGALDSSSSPANLQETKKQLFHSVLDKNVKLSS
ncbi:hypothetical protein BV898_15503 [Hypsibius exemplaris]|uniref:Small integral membrane protein 12 n=1 Tax=Hypsibius exemplaris TaxID=2072580 RepID=A0A9X6NB54_HYPEX|nr:hypothetical protein BV898_15503 [Hypsibius exemplaris]